MNLVTRGAILTAKSPAEHVTDNDLIMRICSVLTKCVFVVSVCGLGWRRFDCSEHEIWFRTVWKSQHEIYQIWFVSGNRIFFWCYKRVTFCVLLCSISSLLHPPHCAYFISSLSVCVLRSRQASCTRGRLSDWRHGCGCKGAEKEK